MSEDWNRIESTFHKALEISGRAREEYLTAVRAQDSSLGFEVDSLLHSLESDESFMAKPVVELGLRVVACDQLDDILGSQIGPYFIDQKIGEGGMGDVYRARDTRLNREVALKFISTSVLDDDLAKRQLVREAQAVAMLNHRNVCPIYGLEEIEGRRFIAMEYIRGRTLSELIKEAAINHALYLPIAKGIAKAIASAHLHGIIHRDIKPGNIMLTDEMEVKVLDFGLAKIIHSKNESIPVDQYLSQASSGLIFGTIAYMSPEQLKVEKLDYRSDIFSMGTVLFELATGKHPFERPSQAETISAIIAEEYPEGLLENSKIPESLVRAIKRSLAKERDVRFQSVNELLLELNGPKKRRRADVGYLIWRVLIPLFLVLCLGVGVYLFLRPATKFRVTVLPFTNETGDAGFEFLGDGLAESLITRLSRSTGLEVKAFPLVARFKGPNVDPFDAGRELGSELVLSGKIVKIGDRLFVRTSILDADDGVSLGFWEDECPVSEIHTFQKELADRFLAKFDVEAEPVSDRSLLGSTTANGEAFKEYLIGRHYWRRRDKENIQKAIASFQRSIENDPSFSRPYAGLADSYVLLSLVSYGSVPTREAMTKASAAAKQALEIDPLDPEAHTSLGVVKTKFEWDWAGAEQAYKQAIEIKPDYAPAHYWYSELLALTGRVEESIAEAGKAKTLDPFSLLTDLNYARAYYYGRQYDRALEILANQENVAVTDRKIRYMSGLSYLQKGMYHEAQKAFEDVSRENKLFGAAALGFTYTKIGMRYKALELVRELERSSKNTYIPAQEFAILYIGLDEKDKAFKYLNESLHDRHAALITIKVEPLFDPLRSDPRFEKILATMSLK